MWFAGLPAPPLRALAEGGVVGGQLAHSPVVGWRASRVAVGREPPAVVFVPATMPRNVAAWWHCWQLATAVATVVWPATLRVGELMFAVPSLKPPTLTLAVEWQPEPLQSSVPIGMWLFASPAIVIVLLGGGPAKGPVPAPWQARQLLTPWCTPVTE